MADFACPTPGCTSTKTSVRQTFKSRTEVERQRVCNKGHVFTTYERAPQGDFEVLRHTRKSSGKKEGTQKFNREKLERSIKMASASRLDSTKIALIVDDVIADLRKTKKSPIDSETIGFAVLGRLQHVSRTAWSRYATVFLVDRDEVEDVESLRRWFAGGISGPGEYFERPTTVLKRPHARRGASALEPFSLTKLWEGMFAATKGLTTKSLVVPEEVDRDGDLRDLTPHEVLVGVLVAGVLERIAGPRRVTVGQLSAACIDVLREVVPLGYIRYVTIAKRIEDVEELIVECDAVAAWNTSWAASEEGRRHAAKWTGRELRETGIALSREVLDFQDVAYQERRRRSDEADS